MESLNLVQDICKYLSSKKAEDIIMIEEALISFEKFEGDKKPTEWYRKTTDQDFKRIDFYMIEDAIPHLTR